MKPSFWAHPIEQAVASDAREQARRDRLAAHRRWTQTDINDLRVRVLAGASLVDLATQTGREAADISAMAYRLRLNVTAGSRSPTPS
jgi:hypothetical protein